LIGEAYIYNSNASHPATRATPPKGYTKKYMDKYNPSQTKIRLHLL
jgi:hypothetical protein